MVKKQTMIEIRGGGATRKTAPDSDLTLCHFENTDNLSPKTLKKTCLNSFDEKIECHPELDSGSIKIRKDSGSGAGMTEPSHVHPSCHSELDSESINADNNRLRLGGRSDESGKITNSSFRHPELAAKSVERESKRDFMLLPCDSETMNEHKTFVMLNLFHHPNKILKQVQNDIADKSFVWSTNKQNILCPAIRSDESSRMPRTTFRHSDGSQSLSMQVNSIWHLWHQKSCKAAFTMAEVLITLGIIGIVAAMTLPALVGKYQKYVLKQQFKAAYSLIQQAISKTGADMGYVAECYYWDKSPYAGQNFCVEHDQFGACTKYENMPSDYNGKFTECTTFIPEILSKFQVVSTCEGEAFDKGCIPEYEGFDTVKQANSDHEMSDEEAESASKGCGNFRKNAILNDRYVYVFKNGIILMLYSNNGSIPLFALDINGNKGPNKWGYDLFSFLIRGNVNKDLYLDGRGSCMIPEKGGVTTNEMIRNMQNIK